jgi:HNH endonuclease
MASISEIKPWATETPGERLFLLAYDLIRNTMPPPLADQSWAVSAAGLSEFMRLTAAMELTHRCLNAAVMSLTVNRHCSTETIRRDLRSSVELYEADSVLSPLAEQSRLAGIAYVDQKLSIGRKNLTHKQEKPYCCWCGRHTSRSKQMSAPDFATVEHLWPEFLGGTSIEENLTIACYSCNCARQHAFTWAWFALQACNVELDANASLPKQIYLALALHRLMRVASGQTRISRTQVSLKDAAKMLRGAIPSVTLQPSRRYTFFEIFHLSSD